MNDAEATDVGSPNFFLNKLGILDPGRGAEQNKLVTYLKKLMEECSKRLLELLYKPNEGDLNRKYWIGLGKRPYLGHKFTSQQYSL